MSNATGCFKDVANDDALERRISKSPNDCDDHLKQLTTVDFQNLTVGQSKERKLFSFLKWFKKSKESPIITQSSASSSPILVQRKNQSCESIDTLFSTQTVRSFAYIQPTHYQPSAPPSSLLDFHSESNSNQYILPKNKNYTKPYGRTKRKAPAPPRLTRENSLPSTLERGQTKSTADDIGTYHRRTLSESFKDKKAGAYIHVQGKRKAPLPPYIAAIHSNLQKNSSTRKKKKKAAPPPPEPKIDGDSIMSAVTWTNRMRETSKRSLNGSEDTDLFHGAIYVANHTKPDLADKEKTAAIKCDELGVQLREPQKKKFTEKTSCSAPFVPKPWYKRSYVESGDRKDLRKNFEKKKYNENQLWIFEIGFPRKNAPRDGNINKFNVFSRIVEDRRKEEKRKSQISILTNISELDKEAAEILRKEQAEEKRIMSANDAKFYTPSLASHSQHVSHSTREPLDNGLTPGKAVNRNTANNGIEAAKIYQTNDMYSSLAKLEKQNITDHVHEKNDTEITTATDKETIAFGTTKISVEDKKKKKGNLSKDISMDEKVSFSSVIGKKKPEPTPITTFNDAVPDKNKMNYFNGPWVCSQCTLENAGWKVFCEMCSSVKPGLFTHMKNTEQENVKKKIERTLQSNLPDSAEQLKVDLPYMTLVKEAKEKSADQEKNLEELRQKRISFFSGRLESSSNNQITNESDLPTNNSDTTQTKETESTQSKVVEEKKCLKIETNGTDNQKFLKNTVGKFSMSNYEKPDRVFKEPSFSDGKNTVEAYVITKTIVLEDVTVKKPGRPKLPDPLQKSLAATNKPQQVKMTRTPNTTKNDKGFTGTSNSLQTFFKQKLANKKLEQPLDLTITSQVIPEENISKFKDVEELTNKLTRIEGLRDFKASIQSMLPNSEMNKVAVNRLLRRLEAAINEGDQYRTAGLAKELALMKINCSDIRQVSECPNQTSTITIDMYVEDKLSHEGPIQILVSPSMTLLQLKNKVHQELGIPMDEQRWILGKKLETDDSKTLESDGVRSDSFPVFLYLMSPDLPKFKEVSLNDSSQYRETQSDQANIEDGSLCYEHENVKKDLNSSYTKKSYSVQKKAIHTSHSETSTCLQRETKRADSKLKNKKTDIPSISNFKIHDSQNKLEEDLKKIISLNSVKEKIERLNGTFTENNHYNKSNLNSSEHWICSTCTFLNSPTRVNCSVCSLKKQAPVTKSESFDRYELASTKKSHGTESIELNGEDSCGSHYKELIQLQDTDLVLNSEPFNCPICLAEYSFQQGVTLKDCIHTFCRTCLIKTVQYSEEAEVRCPYMDDNYSCTSVLQQREIKALVPQRIFELHLAKSVKEAENKIKNTFHCKTPDCKGWCIYEDNVNEFHCPVCQLCNCLTCHAIHTGINCKQYQDKMKYASETDTEAKKTKAMLEEMVEKGDAMICPKCKIILMKKWGCDWLRCSVCKTEICWVTRGFRWGPNGKGDTTGGCKCGLNGVKCHPKCNYCH